MPFCTQCAHAIPEGSRFCPACGAPVAAATATTAPAPAAPAAPVAARPGSGSVEDPTQTSAPRATGDSPASLTMSSSGTHGRFDPGTRLGTRYRIVALLGRGGMGEVYRADDLELGQSVALKFLPPGVAASASELARFRSEVRIARQIAHPNVCRVYDIGEADGHVFLSMEYIDGEDLAAVLRRMGRPTPDKAVELARQVCLGLAAAHEAGMLHRDLKPANIMVDGRGRARITDFGLAGLAVELAKGGQIAGTPAYMAPEQLVDGSVSVRSDIYSLGLVLYELFTGRRAFNATSQAELRRLQDSSSVTSPSDLARDIDPAVERLILHCLERDPDARPASAYAVLGALPGGDPLAAALAAGETPSPELVANASDRGGLSPAIAVGCVFTALAGLAVWAGLIGPEFRVLTEPTPVLSVRAADILLRTGSFTTLPRHSTESFSQRPRLLRHLRAHPDSARPAGSAVYFWRRWSPRLIETNNIHAEISDVGDPGGLAPGEAVVMLTPDGRLEGLRAVPPDSVPAARGPVQWGTWLAAAGIDTLAFQPVAPPRAAPAACDTSAAWRGTLANGRDTVTVQMGASRGRLTYFTQIHDWGVTTSPVDAQPPRTTSAQDLLDLLLFAFIPLVASMFFGWRNLQLGRGDWRNATRIAGFVFVMNMLEALFTTKLSEVGLVGAGYDWVAGRAFGHSLIHAVGMWFAYMALEPYVRRLWPRMLVSWTRLVSGRASDPLVGRDLLLGVTVGVVLTALDVLVKYAANEFGWASVPAQAAPSMYESITNLSNAGCLISYSGSVCVLNVLESLVMVLLLRLVLRNTAAAVAITMLLITASYAQANAPDTGWPVAILEALLVSSAILVMMRIGLLAAVTTAFVGLVTSYGVASLDLSSWYADRILLPLSLLLALIAYGTATALAGRSILGDPLAGPKSR